MYLDKFENHTRAFVKIQDGCNNFCSYCIIPYTRGNVRSKKKENVISEIKVLVKNGYKEVVLTAVNEDGSTFKYASEQLKNDKEVVLTAVKKDGSALKYASPGIQKLCEGQDSVEALTRAIQAEKLQARLNKTLAPKHENTRRIKI